MLNREISTKLTEAKILIEEWRRLGYDTNSLIADPLFVDPEKDNYRPKPDSPAFTLGFEETYVDLIGPRDK